MKHPLNKSILASCITMAFASTGAYAAGVNDLFGDASFSTDSANFTMLAANGGVVGGTNDVNMVWDGDGFTSDTDYTGPGSYANVTASSTAAFFGHMWTAHDIQVFVPGTYSFDVTLGGGNPEIGIMNATVGFGQMGMHMLFDWNGNLNIDVFVVAQASSIFGAGVGSSTNSKCSSSFTGTIKKNCLYDGPLYGNDGQPAGYKVWMMASVDGDGDGVMGIPMAAGGPFAGFNANFNFNLTAMQDFGGCGICTAPVPIPASVWLLGSGLMGLVVAHRRKRRDG